MSNPAYRWRVYGLVAIAALLIAAVIAYFTWNSTVPGPSSSRYQWMVSAFYPGAIALAADDVADAPTHLQKATQIVPKEPAAWADLGLYEMMLENPDTAQAQQYLNKAQSLAPKNSDIEALLGALAELEGNYELAIDHLNKAVALDPSNIKARYRLKEVIDQQSDPDSDAKQEEQLQGILAVQPNNLLALLDLAKLAAKEKQRNLLNRVIAQIETQSKNWSLAGVQPGDDPFAQLKVLQKAASGSDPSPAEVEVIRLRNILTRTPNFQEAQDLVGNPDGKRGEPITHFILLPSPSNTPAAPDMGLTFASQTIPATGKVAMARQVWLNSDTPSAIITLGASGLAISLPSGAPIHLAFPGNAAGLDAVLPIDWNDNTRVDLALAGSSGLKLYQQSASGPAAFTDVTSRSKLPAGIVNGRYTGAWTATLETGGELDIVLGGNSGPALALRNNGDGSFTPIHPFPGANSGVRSFAWMDLDNDGLSDAALIDNQGRLAVYHNEGSGVFTPWAIPAGFDHIAALCAADVDRTGSFSLVALGTNGSLQSLSLKGDTVLDVKNSRNWAVATLGKANQPPGDGSARLFAADMDNNGGPDLVVTSSEGTQILLSDAQGLLTALSSPGDVREASIVDDGKSEWLGLVGLSSAGAHVLLQGKGTRNYGWQRIRLIAQNTKDGNRNNSYGIGSQIALRAGLLYENQMVAQPTTHFGLGDYARADAARIVWPNGNPQAEFSLDPNSLFSATERLKGSCPWLFAWNGHDMAFLTDFLWRSALGLRIGAQNTAGVPMTSDWNRISGDQLVPRDGFYDFRLTTQLWETYYFDQIKLIVVDHPAGTSMWVDERFSIPPPKLAYHIMSEPRPIARATDQAGHDVTDLLAARDGRYVDSFARAGYQGLAENHFLQADLGKAPDTHGRQWLLANGWIHPTDSSINLALSFGSHPHPHGLVLSIPNGHGGWKVVRPDLGFPEGKNKTILIDLTGLFKPGQERMVRLATNMEIYWDWMATAIETPPAKSHREMLSLSTADLRYHGFNVVSHNKLSSPEVPNYDHLAALGQQWRDMTGYFTRYGDVKELLAGIDDRYVIMNAGDEIALRFAAPPPPPAGWTRDFILTGDGWGKDCDISTGYGRTVLPLPSHADNLYTRAPTTLANEPVYKAHKADWQNYQTRYVSPREFDNAFLP